MPQFTKQMVIFYYMNNHFYPLLDFVKIYIGQPCVLIANTAAVSITSFSECSWPRTKDMPCHKITDKMACLTSKDNRRGFEGQNCVWCKSGKCEWSGGKEVCEPQTWMEGTKNKKAGTDFEACLRPQSKCSQGKCIK